MIIDTLKVTDISKAKKLWKQAFGDSDVYIDFNFETNLDLKKSLAIFEEDQLVCMLFMIPKTVVMDNVETKTFFIAGVSTDNKFRYKGYAKKLMERSHADLKAQGIPFVFLFPFNHDFYRKLGYETVNMMKKATLESSMTCGPINDTYTFDVHDVSSVKLLNRVSSIYDSYTCKFDGYFKRSLEDFEKTIETLFVEGGHVMVIGDGVNDVGWIFYYLDGRKVECQQSMFLNEEATIETCRYLSKHVYDGFVYYDTNYKTNNDEIIEYAMVMILDDQPVVFKDKKILILEQY